MSQDTETTTAATFEVTSRDGTRILSNRSGSGPPLVLVTGGLMDGSDWQRLEAFLRPSRTVYALNRRGRGGSGDTQPYKPEREIDDFFALTEAIGGEVDMLAHSSGTILALMALERGLPLRRVILYEPPLQAFRSEDDDERHDRVHQLIEAGDLEGALRAFLRDAFHVSPEQVERAPSGPRWAHQMEMIATVPHDHLVTSGYVFDPARLRRITAPVLVLAGTTSAAWFQKGARALCEALPNARLHVLEGQGHIAMFTAPAELARVTDGFLSEA